ncbi:MAG TPA: hypothetical protein VH436_25765, partial [Vicinamibacterales bacterium]
MTTPARETGVVPSIEELVPAPDPVECCERLEGLPYRLLLESAARERRLGRYSFLTADPVLIVRSRGVQTEIVDCTSGATTATHEDALTTVRRLVASHRVQPILAVPPFQGGIAGFIAYDWGLTLERLPEPRFDDLALPDTLLCLYDWVLAWDHATSQAWLISTGVPEI